MAEDGSLGPNEIWANGVMHDIKDGKDYPLCGVVAFGMLVFLAAFIWFLVEVI
jgi:hypothetical protein